MGLGHMPEPLISKNYTHLSRRHHTKSVEAGLEGKWTMNTCWGKRENSMGGKEKGKVWQIRLRRIPTSQQHREHARATRKDFTVGLLPQPPILNHCAHML